jgi:hypothetical protein
VLRYPLYSQHSKEYLHGILPKMGIPDEMERNQYLLVEYLFFNYSLVNVDSSNGLLESLGMIP